jgi:hypothetical protein
MIRPGPLAPLVRAATSKDCVHIGDLSQDAAYIERDPNVVALVDGGHVRTILVVPMKGAEICWCIEHLSSGETSFYY